MTMSPVRSAKPFFEFIDGLRGIAVLSVLVFHLKNSWLPGGFLGVDIFFVISGFVVSHSVREFKGSFGDFIIEFYRRRVLRILPPLIVCLILTAIFSVLFIPGDQSLFSKISRASHFAISNFAMIKENANYFSPTADFHPLTHTWSLGIEEQFYLFFPVVFYFCVLRPRWSFDRRLAFVAILAASLVYSVLHRGDTTTTFYGFFPRVWELSIGVLAYLFSDSANSQGPTQPLRRASPLALVLLCVVIIATFQQTSEGLSAWQFVAAVSTGALLFLLRAPGLSWARRALELRPLRWTGRISYSLYLFHWPVIVLLRWTLGMEAPESLLIATALSFGLGGLCYYCLERPMKVYAHTPRGQQARPTIALGLGTLLGSSILTAQIYAHSQKLSLSVVARNSSDWSTGALFLDATCGVQTFSENGATVYRRQPGSQSSVGASSCAPNLSQHRLFVVGDSHAGAYSTLFKKLAEKDVAAVHLLTMPGCTTFSLIGYGSEDCARFIRESFERILEMAGPTDVLFLPGLRIWRLTNYHANPSPLATPQSFEKPEIVALHNSHVENGVELLRPLLDRGLRILLEAPKPLYRISPFRCADSFNRNNPLCRWGFSLPREELTTYFRVPRETLQRISDTHPRILLWDPFAVLCPETAGNACSPLFGKRPLFYDYDHLSPYGNEVLYPHLRALVTSSDSQ